MRAETLEGGDMINGPPTALEEPPVPSPIHPHHPATHPSSNCILHQVWSPKKKTQVPIRVRSKLPKIIISDRFFCSFGFLVVLHGTFRILHSHDGWTMTPPSPTHTPPSLSLNVNSSKIRALERTLQESSEEVFTTSESDRLKKKNAKLLKIWGTHTEKLHLTWASESLPH